MNPDISLFDQAKFDEDPTEDRLDRFMYGLGTKMPGKLDRSTEVEMHTVTIISIFF